MLETSETKRAIESYPRYVLKIGGSVLFHKSGIDRFREWFARQSFGDYFAIVGGGQIIEAVRELDSKYCFDSVETHWRCIQLLDTTFEMLKEILIESTSIEYERNLADVLRDSKLQTGHEAPLRRLFLCKIRSFYRRFNEIDSLALKTTSMKHLFNESVRMPNEDWSTSSDTLAAYLACRIHAHECIFLKSCPLEPEMTLNRAVASGIVDAQVLEYIPHHLVGSFATIFQE